MKRAKKHRGGRVAGQSAKAHSNLAEAALPEAALLRKHLDLAWTGDFAPGVTDFLADCYELTILPPVVDGRIIYRKDPLDPGFDQFLRECERRGFRFTAVGPVPPQVARVLTPLLLAVRKRDARFFQSLAHRLQGDLPLYGPAEPLFRVVASARQRQRHDPEWRPTAKELQRQAAEAGERVNELLPRANAVGRGFDERTIRRHAKIIGLLLAPPGRPRKPGT